MRLCISRWCQVGRQKLSNKINMYKTLLLLRAFSATRHTHHSNFCHWNLSVWLRVLFYKFNVSTFLATSIYTKINSIHKKKNPDYFQDGLNQACRFFKSEFTGFSKYWRKCKEIKTTEMFLSLKFLIKIKNSLFFAITKSKYFEI